jgi:hypothetical protein
MGAVKAWWMDLQALPQYRKGWDDELGGKVHISIADMDRFEWTVDQREAYRLGRRECREERQPRYGEP